MQYFRNHELASMYKVSQAAVGKWIAATQKGKLELVLIEQEGKNYVANTSKNLIAIDKMVKARKKYYNKRSLKTVTPLPEFYKIYSKEQIFDIISNIDIHREIPHQYSYFNGGADYWEKYAQKLIAENTPNLITGTIKLLKLNQAYIDSLLAPYKTVNVVDLGVGDCSPIKDLLAHLLDKGVLGRYIALDISQEMIAKARRNLKRWFGGKVAFEGYNRDINYDRFVELMSPDSGTESINVVLCFGGTLSNLRTPSDSLKIINKSMGRNDIFIYSGLIDTPQTRLYFDFDLHPGAKSILTYKMILDLLNIDESYYEVERLFDEQVRARFIRLRFKVALTLKFELPTGIKQIEINKGECLLTWRHWHYSTVEYVQNLDDCKFDLLHMSQTLKKDCVLTVAKIKTGV